MVCICVAKSYAQGYSSAKEFLPSCVSRHLDWEVSAEKKKKKDLPICFPSMLCPAQWHRGCRQELHMVPGADFQPSCCEQPEEPLQLCLASQRQPSLLGQGDAVNPIAMFCILTPTSFKGL